MTHSQAEEIARFCARWDMRLEENLGSDGYVRQLVDLARQLPLEAGRSLSDGNACVGTAIDDHAQISPNGGFSIDPPGGTIGRGMCVR